MATARAPSLLLITVTGLITISGVITARPRDNPTSRTMGFARIAALKLEG